jgi:hypothetical protein
MRIATGVAQQSHHHHHAGQQQHGIGVDRLDRLFLGVEAAVQSDAYHGHCADDRRVHAVHDLGEDQGIRYDKNQTRYDHRAGQGSEGLFQHA